MHFKARDSLVDEESIKCLWVLLTYEITSPSDQSNTPLLVPSEQEKVIHWVDPSRSLTRQLEPTKHWVVQRLLAGLPQYATKAPALTQCGLTSLTTRRMTTCTMLGICIDNFDPSYKASLIWSRFSTSTFITNFNAFFLRKSNPHQGENAFICRTQMGNERLAWRIYDLGRPHESAALLF